MCGSFRSGQHESDVDGRKESSAFYKHIRLFHPDAPGGNENFDIKVMSILKKPLTRQKTEAVKIASSTAINLFNSKAEQRQPALLRVRMVQGNDNEPTDLKPLAKQGGCRGGLGIQVIVTLRGTPPGRELPGSRAYSQNKSLQTDFNGG